jgi:hypothetical protein
MTTYANSPSGVCRDVASALLMICSPKVTVRDVQRKPSSTHSWPICLSFVFFCRADE